MQQPWMNLAKMAQGQLCDPLMMDWAIRYYIGIPDGLEQKEWISENWFDDSVLAHWIAQDDYLTLGYLLRDLPPQRFAKLAPSIAERWSAWPTRIAEPSTSILAQVAPETAAQLFQEYLLRADEIDAEKVWAILANLDKLPQAEQAAMLSQLLLAMLSEENSVSFIPHAAVKVAAQVMPETLPRLLDHLLSSPERSPDHPAKTIVNALIGHDSYVELCFPRVKQAWVDDIEDVDDEYEESLAEIDDDDDLGDDDEYAFGNSDDEDRFERGSLAELAAFFDAAAPLVEIDQIVAAETPLPQAMQLLAAYCETSKTAALAFDVISTSESYAKQLHSSSLAAIALAVVANIFELKQLDTERLNAEQVVNLLARDLHCELHFAQLVERLRGFPKEDVVSNITLKIALIKQFEGEDAGQLVSAVRSLGWVEFVQPLIGYMDDACNEILCFEVHDALIALGSPARDALIMQWDKLDYSQQNFGIMVIGIVGGTEVADFFLDNFAVLLESSVESWEYLASLAPDPSVLALVADEIHQEQDYFDLTYYCLSCLLGVSSPELPAVRERALELHARHKRKMMTDDDDEDVLGLMEPELEPEPFELALRCPICGETNHYDVKSVLIGDPLKYEQVLVADEFPCRSCGAIPEFEIVEEGKETILQRLKEALALDFGEKEIAMSVFIGGDFQYRNGMAEPYLMAYAKLMRKRASNPFDVDSRLELSLLLNEINRPEAALACSLEAHAINPSSLEVILSLTQDFEVLGRVEEAFELLSRCVADRAQWKLGTASAVDAAEELAARYNLLLVVLGHRDIPPLALQLEPIPAKVGRNDPCPCGSGKKYKKCCLK